MKPGVRQWILVLTASITVAVVASVLASVMLWKDPGSSPATTANLQQRLIDGLAQLDERVERLEGQSLRPSYREQTDGIQASGQAAALDELRRKLAAFSERLDRLERSVTDSPSAIPENPNTTAPDQREQAALSLKRQIEDLENRLSRESVDSSLGSSVNYLVSQVLAKKPEWSFDSQVTIDCGSTICRVQIVFSPDMASIDRFELENTLIQTLASELPEGAALQYRTTPDGGRSLVGYFSRTTQNQRD